ncbi:DUF2752 domain-containing protein [Blastopirellula marina]|uniref:DUF2752 domain-containing protein n=1 Tax=Blastopirellula marina TaxID=124 RepID=A0A2S8GPG5_9BACT|nr:DUF2752 domain-containing protein [Blastopirellula marina]PQO46336.1 hypothetical protein C5Y93_10155 [Blastopirellula marina]
MSSSLVMPLPDQEPGQRSSWTFHVMMLSLALPVLGLSFLLNVQGPHDVVIPWLQIPLPPTCGMQRTFGLDCPGCGLTRSFICLAHGDLTASLAYNPGGILVFALVVFQIPYRLAQLGRIWSGRTAWDLTHFSLWMWSLIGLVLLTQWGAKLIL